MSPVIRLAIGFAAAVNLALGLAFALQMDWAVSIWPTDTGRLTYIFIGSILAAIAAGAGWIAISGEKGSLPAGFLNLAIMMAGIGSYLLVRGTRTDQGDWIVYGLVGLVLAVVNLALFLRTRNVEVPDPEPLPWPVRGSYALFTVVLLLVGGSLILRTDGIMPWSLDPDTSVIVGLIFLANAFYFLFAVIRSTWQAARAQWWSFLAYDVVLIVPLIRHIPDISDDLRTNLFVYIAILVYSGVLAIYYVILNRRTRGWDAGSFRSAKQ